MGEKFKSWVQEVIVERNNRIAENRKLIIELDPAVATAFRDSVNISSKFLPSILATLKGFANFGSTFSKQG